MVEDKYSKDLRTTQKTKEDFSYFDSIKDEEFKKQILKHVEEKTKEPIQFGEFYWVPAFFKDKDGNDVKMVYRFFDKEKADAKANSGGGNKQWAPRKEYYKTYKDAIPVPLTDYITEANERASGKEVLTAELVGSNGAIFYNQDGVMCRLMGKVFKVEL